MNLIFDFDGTLCDNLTSTVKIANKYFHLIGMRLLTEEEYRSQGLKGVLKSRHIPLFLSILAAPIMHYEYERILPSLVLFPELIPILRQLGSKHTLGILTNNSVANVRHVLQKCQLADLFSFIYSEPFAFNKHSSLGKILTTHHLISKDTYYIGDALRDIEAAHKIGVKSIGVTWGHESDSILSSANPTKLITSPQQLLQIG
jgi:phosphoglycolate phosphatase